MRVFFLGHADEQPRSVMSKFSVTTEGARALSISSAKLVSTGSYEIAACGRDNGGLVSLRHVLALSLAKSPCGTANHATPDL